MDAPTAEAAGGQPNPPPPPTTTTDTANAAGGEATLAVPPPLLTATAVPPPPPAAAQPQPQQATEAKGEEPPPPPATAAEAVVGNPQPPTTPASEPPAAPPEPPRATEEKGDEPPPPASTSTGAKEEVAGHAHGQPPPPTSTPASKPPAPPEPTQQQQQQAGDAAKQAPSSAHDEDGGKKKHSRWHFLRNFRRHKGSLREAVKATASGAGADGALTKPSQAAPDEAKLPTPPSLTEKIKSLVRTDSSCLTGGAAAEDGGNTPGSTPAAEAEAEAPPPAPDDGAASRPTRKKLMKVLWAVQFITWLKNRRNPPPPDADGRQRQTGDQAEEGKRKEDQKPPPEKEEKPPETEKEKKPPEPEQAEKPAAQQLEEEAEEEKKKKEEEEAKSRRRWKKREEARLQEILEAAFTKLLAGEFDKLKEQWRQCLLTFSFFPVNHKVKKQAVTYWWAAQFGLPHRRPPGGDEAAEPRGAEEIFGELCGSGFLEPITNRCSGVSHGCCVNPLVHWMVKRMARGGFADLDPRGEPADEMGKSKVFCLTASHRERLQRLGRADESPSLTKKLSKGKRLQGEPKEQQNENDKTNLELELKKFANVLVILNINAHVYRLPDCLLSYLGDHLVVLQLGRWWNSDNNTYMEVEGLEKLSAIGNLKKLRYLGIRGLSKLMELPKEVNKLQQLEVLDVRGCQNLTRLISSTIKNLRRLTHLDLTECYMLEHIGREITSLSELQVFKGFVFGVDAPWNNMFHWRDRYVCRLQDFRAKMKNLQKLSINVTTDANVDKNEMTQLKHLESLRSLTITWGELPSILTSEERDEEKNQLLQRWTNLVLPPKLEKLDVRCYPTKDIPLEQWFEPKGPKPLKKLYVRGGAVQKLKLPKDNNIETLRLRYLREFNMKWKDMLDMMKKLCYVEVVYKDAKVMKSEIIICQTYNVELQPHVVKQEEKKAKEEEGKHMVEIKNKMDIPESTLDEHGVWERDPMEADPYKKKEGFEGDEDGSNDAPESGHDTKALTDDNVTKVSSDSNMVGKGDVQAPNIEPPKEEREQKEKQVGGPKVLLASNVESIMEHSKSGNPNEQSSRVNDAFDISAKLLMWKAREVIQNTSQLAPSANGIASATVKEVVIDDIESDK
uniref:Disease resistance R13L4/SHOC-2-like LRR domain-containing protein n=1 Tax=Oryza punctata TaxID=4537 RepID=A0A0E0K0Y3_ORYPU